MAKDRGGGCFNKGEGGGDDDGHLRSAPPAQGGGDDAAYLKRNAQKPGGGSLVGGEGQPPQCAPQL